MSRKRIYVAYVGGTIGMQATDSGYAPVAGHLSALVRGRPEWLRHRLARVLPHVNDTVLLAAAIAMLVAAQWNVFDMPWLGAKIAGLLAYIACGTIALRRGRSQRVRAGAFVAALAAFGYVVSVAFSKSAAGPFVRLLH